MQKVKNLFLKSIKLEQILKRLNNKSHKKFLKKSQKSFIFKVQKGEQSTADLVANTVLKETNKLCF